MFSVVSRCTNHVVQYVIIGFLALAMAGCGGGGSSEDLVPGSGSNGGDTGGSTGGGAQSYSVLLRLTDLSGTNTNLGSSSEPISATDPARASVVVTKDGAKVEGAVVKFTSTLGEISPASGTELTDENGNASVILRAGSVEGAGTITVSLESDDTVKSSMSFKTKGDADADSGTVDNSNVLDLSLRNQANTSDLSAISKNDLGLLISCLKDTNAQPVAGQVITFQSTLGVISPAAGTALTQSDGCATVNLSPGSTAGAATATASYGNLTAKVNFQTDGSGSDVQVGSLRFTSTLNEVSSSEPADVVVEVRNASGTVQANKIVNFSTDLGTLSPESGRVLTDVNGLATVQLDVGDNTGAGTVSASVDFDNQTVRESQSFKAVQDEIQFGYDDGVSFQQGVLGLSNTDIAAGSTITVSANLVNVSAGNIPYADEATVTFESVSCSAESSIESSKIARGGVVTVTYTAGAGCVQDKIRAVATINGEAFEAESDFINIETSPASSIEYTGSDVPDDQLGIKGSAAVGRQESATLSFLIKDQNGHHLTSPTDVRFTLSTSIGGIAFAGGGTTVVRQSDSQGVVTVQVNSGTVPTSLAVQATLVSDTSVTTSTNSLSVNAGLPVQDRFFLSVETHNPSKAGANYNTDDEVSIVASDQLGNPVPDGTNIQFVAELGSIQPSCKTVDGRCSVTWVSPGPDGIENASYDPNKKSKSCVQASPGEFVSQYGVARFGCGRHDRFGRSTILAYTPGVESFQDTDGDYIWGTASDGSDKTFIDLPDPFLDQNETGLYGVAPNNNFFNIHGEAYQDKNGQYNGINGDCDRGGDCRIYVRRQLVIVASTSTPQFYTFASNADLSNAEWASKTAWEADGSNESPKGANDAYYINTSKGADIPGVAVNPDGQITDVTLSELSGGFSMGVLVADLNGNSTEYGTTVTVDGGGMFEVAGSGSCTINSTTEPSACNFVLTIKPDGDKITPVVVTVETPSAGQFTRYIGVSM